MPKLSEDFIAKAEPPEKGRRLIFDDHKDAPRGFGLRITAAGTVSFVLRYRSREGHDRLLTIGEHGTWSLAAARKKAGEYRQQVDQGTDILDERRAERAELTVSDVVDRYCKAHVDKLASAKAVRGMFDNHLIPALGTTKMRKVRRRDVIELLEGLAAKRGRSAALLLGHIKGLFAWAEDRELIEGNPVATLRPQKIGKELSPTKRGRVLSDDEIRALWESAEQCGIHRLTALALKFIIVTGQRPGEVCGMRHAEVDGAMWVIPAARRGKTGTAHAVPLTETARSLIDTAKVEVARLGKRKPRTGEFVFEARPGQPLSVHGMDRAVKRFAEALGNCVAPSWGHWRPHDLRRTMRTGLAAAGVNETVAELTIGHTRKGIAAVYDRHRYDAEKRAALEAWERRLLRIAEGKVPEDNVVPLAK